jgi:TRAP-type C4-dicarboxylate transport system substrate-binding protein
MGGPEPTADAYIMTPGGFLERKVWENSGGRFKLTVRENMVPEDQAHDLIASNDVQLSDFTASDISGTWPALDWESLPFRFNDLQEIRAASQDPELHQLMQKQWANAGLVYLANVPGGAMKYYWAKEPILKVSEFQGMKIRVRGATATNTMNLLGASPISIPGSEIADALFRGLADVITSTLDFGLSQGLGDVATQISIWNSQPNLPGGIYANTDAFNALPDDLKLVLIDASKWASELVYYAAVPEEEASMVWVSTTQLQIVYPDKAEVDKAREMVKPAIDDWLKIAGPDGQKILDVTAKYIK